jgi:hypothetical protein
MNAPSSTRGSSVRLFKIEQVRAFLFFPLTFQAGREEISMKPTGGCTESVKLGFDSFRQLDNGGPIWVSHQQTRASAEREISLLQRFASARYLSRDAEAGALIADSGLGVPGRFN